MVKRKWLFVRQGARDVNGDESYLYANDLYDGMAIDNRILASDNEPDPLEHFDSATDAAEDHYCMGWDVCVFHICENVFFVQTNKRIQKLRKHTLTAAFVDS